MLNYWLGLFIGGIAALNINNVAWFSEPMWNWAITVVVVMLMLEGTFWLIAKLWDKWKKSNTERGE